MGNIYIFAYHREIMRGSFAKQQSVIEWSLAISFISLHCGTLDIAFKFSSQGFFFLFSNKYFKDIGQAVAFASETKLSRLPSVWREKNPVL